MPLTYPRKRDDNEKGIVAALKARGAIVTPLTGAGVPDLLVGYQGKTFLLEVKMPSRSDGKAHSREGIGGAGELTESQVKWWTTWLGAPAAIVHDEREALVAIGAA